MKKVLLALLVSLGIQTQAQTLCDSNMTYTTGNFWFYEVAIPVTGNGLPDMAPLYAITTNTWDTFEDSCFGQPCNHSIWNENGEDTITTCISYTLTDAMGYVDTLMCCIDHYWDGQFWIRLTSTTVGIEEYPINQVDNNKIYDLLGRELTEIPVGTMYIRNQKLHIKK